MTPVGHEVPSRSGDGVHRLGPQRNPEIDASVLKATRELLVERGYQAVSIDAIASRAGVGRPTVYRRWRSKAHIVHDAIYPSIEPTPLAEGTLEDRLTALVTGAFALFGMPHARAGVPGLMSETRSDPELRAKLVTEQLEPVRLAVAQLIAEGVAAGQVRADADADTVVDVLAGAAIFALGVRNADDAPVLAARVSELIIRGIRVDPR
ncbi:TetR/AcrR family transcriptional regulator [Tomitella gaofuii]|uniref:TetR/AcrR family transcriptional regulator n=1 Tax=Tomitella gaofuii TaxID=2760083 RepID=UPI0015F914F4|nr:TetR/AcrR family transcriptional regulator [Tomitella gaofuii]